MRNHRGSRFQVLVLFCTVALLTATANTDGATGPAGGRETTTGVVQLVIHCDLERGQDTMVEQTILVDGRHYPLVLGDRQPSWEAGATLRFPSELIRDGAVDLSGLPQEALPQLVLAAEPAAPTSGGPGDTVGLNRAIFLLGDNDGASGVPITIAEAEQLMADLDAWFQEVSFGKTWIDADVAGWYDMPTDSEDFSLLSQAAIDDGFDFNEYDRIIVGYSKNGRSFSTVGKTTITVGQFPNQYQVVASRAVMYAVSNSGGFRNVLYHELGHSYGLHHANYRNSNTGSVVEYANINDAMGLNSHRHFNAGSKDFLQWFDPQQVQEVTTSGTYTIGPLEQASPELKTLKILKENISGTDYYFYVEYREPIGEDAGLPRNATEGALINVIRDGSSASRTAAIDGSPETPTLNSSDSALLPGQSLCDERSGVCLTVLSRQSGQLEVRVHFVADDPDNRPPDPPTVVTTVYPLGDGTFAVVYDGESEDPDGDPVRFFWNFDTNWYLYDLYDGGNYAQGSLVAHVFPDDDPIRSYVKVTDTKGGETDWVPIDLFGFQDTFISVPNDYPTIQAAIAASAGGETIEIDPGTYTGDGNRDIELGSKRVTVRGKGPGATILDCQGSAGEPHRAFIFDNTGSFGGSRYHVVENLTIRNGYADRGGAAFVGFHHGPVFRDNVIEDNHATQQGGAFYIEKISIADIGGGPKLVGNTIRNNSAASNGGAIYSQQAGEFFMLDGNLIMDNTAVRGAGLYHNSPRYQATIRNNLWAGNTATADGGGLYLGSSTVPIPLVGNTVTRNSALGNGAGVYTIGSRAEIGNGILWDNDSSAGIFAVSGQPQIRYSDVMGGFTGDGNIDADPEFLDPDAGDFRLKKLSACVDGADGFLESALDLRGKPRYDVLAVPNTGIGLPDYVDMGAYERQKFEPISVPFP